MNVVELQETSRRRTPASRCIPLFALAWLMVAGPRVGAAAGPAAPDKDAAAEEDVISLAAYNVKADRIEDFGFRVSQPGLVVVVLVPIPQTPFITEVFPNTAAAKAGLQPGDRILKSDGQSASASVFNLEKWRKLMKAKNAEAASGKRTVTWTLEIQPRGTKSRAGSAPGDGPLVEQAPRTVTLTLPTPPPHWGAAVWHAPAGRKPAIVAETGPLADRSRAILDHGIWISIDPKFLVGASSDGSRHDAPNGYEWHFGNVDSGGSHRMIVTQTLGRTVVMLEATSSLTGYRVYRTSPSGALERAWRFTRQNKGEIPIADARAGFEHELDLWATKVRKLSPRWPFEVIPGYDPNAIFAVLAAKTGAPPVAVARPFAEEFLKLPSATDDQRTLFADAYGKLAADSAEWAYTETSRGLEDQRVTVTRVDPSQPEAERCTLLSIDGKAPGLEDIQRWRDNGGETPRALGDLPPLASLVDLKDLRVFRDETAAVLFELPMRNGSAGFPAEKFQAHFRVNKAQRTLENISVKQRDSFRIAGVVKVVDVGLEMQFQTLDPTLAPQPVLLKMGGGVSVLLVRFSRSFEATRTDFKRVVPFDETAPPAK